MKFVSIPRLELQAAVLATRMFKMNISRTYLWTDSEIVLHYLRNEKRVESIGETFVKLNKKFYQTRRRNDKSFSLRH